MGEIEDFFGEVIHSYSRAEAIRDGVLVDAGDMAREAGFKVPVALTRAVWEDCVTWDAKAAAKTHQDESGRLWDVLVMAHLAAVMAARKPGRQGLPERTEMRLFRIPRTGSRVTPQEVRLAVAISPGDDGAPVFTIMQPGED